MKYILSTALVLACSAASAQQQNCGPRDNVVQQLTERYGETRRSLGMSSQDTVVETWASDRTGSWSIIVTMPNGISCLVASGVAFESFSEPNV